MLSPKVYLVYTYDNMSEFQNNFAQCKKLDRNKTKGPYCMVPFMENSLECKVICSDRKQVSGCLEQRGGEGEITKGHKVILGGDGYICNLDSVYGSKAACICQNLANCRLQISFIYFV